MRRIKNFERGNVEFVFVRNRLDPGLRPYEFRRDQAGLGRVHDPAQRGFVARMHDDRRNRLQLLRAGYQAVVFFVRLALNLPAGR